MTEKNCDYERRAYSPTTRVVDSELPQETRFTLTTSVSETQFVFSREGTLVDIFQCRVRHPEVDEKPTTFDWGGPDSLADIIDKRWSRPEDAND